MSVETIWRAMHEPDPDTGRNRGFFLLTEKNAIERENERRLENGETPIITHEDGVAEVFDGSASSPDEDREKKT